MVRGIKMKAHIENARNKATDMYNKRDRYKARAAPLVEQAKNIFNKHIDKVLVTSFVCAEIWKGESLDNIEAASNLSAAVDYDNYTKG